MKVVLLKDVKGITVMQRPSDEYDSNFWLTCILIDSKITGFDREDLRIKMDEAQIETRPLWKPMHLQPVFANAPMYVNGVSEALFNDGLCLPSGPMCTNDDIRRVVEVITSYK